VLDGDLNNKVYEIFTCLSGVALGVSTDVDMSGMYGGSAPVTGIDDVFMKVVFVHADIAGIAVLYMHICV
jgi:hypothetical protein